LRARSARGRRLPDARRQVVASGILRGLGRTKPAAIFNFCGYSFLALPIACELGLGRG